MICNGAKYISKLVNCLWILSFIFFSCNSLRSLTLRHDLKHSEIFTNQFTGFCLYDPSTNYILSSYHADRHFTPASNMKILTALATLETFGDSLPSYNYQLKGDSLIIQPLADPTFLHPKFPSQPAFSLLKEHDVFISWINSPLDEFGAGWAWDDFQYDFQPERSWFPIYGNTIRIFRNSDSIHVVPEFFKDYTQINYGEKPGDYIRRDQKYNLFNIWIENNYSSFEREIPYDYDRELLARLLSDTINRPVQFVDPEQYACPETAFNQSTLNVVANMMLASDNFLAEQLLIQVALANGYENVDLFRSVLQEKWSTFNPNDFQWYDGSGLSRYNLISPLSLVAILKRIYDIETWERIKIIFPNGGRSGTIKDWYHGDPPYVFAKTGTLKNNHNLSGYLQTQSGRILIFSIMNNNHVAPVSEVKKEMEKLLRKIWKKF